MPCYGDARTLDVKVVDPPPAHLLAIGGDLGISASGGGTIHLRADGKPLTLATTPGETPDRVASELARLADKAGLVAVVSSNARIRPGVASSVDVSLRRKDGTLVAIEAASVPLATDPTLSVRIGSVDLSDGLQHFTDTDAMAGTLEERTLLKALDDGDPSTIEVVVVPLFAGGGRIGESFIGSDLSSIRNVILLDRDIPKGSVVFVALTYILEPNAVALRASADQRRRVRPRRAPGRPEGPRAAPRGLAHHGHPVRHQARRALRRAPVHCGLMTVSCVPPA